LVDHQFLIRNERPGKAALLRLTLDAARTGAADAPVPATTARGACAAPYPRTACAKPPQGVHPKLKEKEPRRVTANHDGAKPLDASTGPESEELEMNWWKTNIGVDAKARPRVRLRSILASTRLQLGGFQVRASNYRTVTASVCRRTAIEAFEAGGP